MTSSPAKTIALLPENDSLQHQNRNTKKEEDDKALLSKCEVDPVKAQDDAMISIALKLQKNQMSVNEFSVDEARTTMVRSNYAPDWTRANWSHPLLANLKNLSCLSSFDLPSHTKRGLVDERKAIAYGQQEAGSSRALSLENNNNTHDENEENGALVVPPSQRQEVVVRDEVIEPEALQYAMEHKTPAIVETTPFLLRQKALLDLSPETINSDPQLLALVSAIANANKSDPRVAGKVAMGEIPTMDVIPQVPSIRNSYPVHRKATDALPKPSTIGNYNKGFHDSDIVGYGKLKDELSPVKGGSDDSSLLIGEAEQQKEITEKKSMHDVGYKTWMQRHLEQSSEYEDRERFAEYRDQVTSLEGKCQSVVERNQQQEEEE